MNDQLKQIFRLADLGMNIFNIWAQENLVSTDYLLESFTKGIGEAHITCLYVKMVGIHGDQEIFL